MVVNSEPSKMSHFKGPDVASVVPDFQPNTSVLELYAEALRRNGDNVAMIEGQTGKSATFKDFLQQSSSIAAGLRSAGVTAGDYVIICCDKSITAFSALLGIIFTGATAVIYPLSHVEIVPQLTGGFPIKAVICDPEYADPLRTSMRDMRPQPALFATTDPRDEVLKTLLTPNGALQIYEVTDVQKHIPIILFSSGTTGNPKGVMITDMAVQRMGRSFKLDVNTFLLISPMYWLSCLVNLTTAIFNNFKLVSSNSADPKHNMELIQKYKVDSCVIGTGSISMYINEPTINDYDISTLKLVGIGGEVLLTSVAEAFRSKVLKGNVKILTGYATTEGGSICGLEVKPDDGRFEFGLCGKVNPGAEIKIKDDNAEVVPVGTLGHVWVKTPGLTTGYWGRPELDKEVFDKEGFFRSEDFGFFNKEEQLYLRGRVGDLINYKGEKISPAEVEDILISHEAVLDAAVVGKPHPTDIQHSTAYVVLNQGFHLSELDLQNFVNGQVPDKMKLRGGVRFLSAIPRTKMIGKANRKVLREME